MPIKYISVDIEASGPTPGKYSMLSFGACLVGDITQQFYREIQPITMNFEKESMLIGCLGLKCLEDILYRDGYDPKLKRSFKPELVLNVLQQKGETPQKAMSEFGQWIRETVKGDTPVFAAAPTSFDGMFILWYFDHFAPSSNPFGYSGEDMNSFYRGIIRSTKGTMKDLNVPDNRKPAHNALEDAIYQAQQFEKVLDMMKQRK